VQSEVEGIHLGMDDYLVKPGNADVLVALLAEKLTARFKRYYHSDRGKRAKLPFRRESNASPSCMDFTNHNVSAVGAGVRKKDEKLVSTVSDGGIGTANGGLQYSSNF
jgi:DNA-binding response OmpR family regulator